MSNDNLMTIVLIGLVVYMMLNNKKSCGCKEAFGIKKCGCSGWVMVNGEPRDCAECNGVALGDEYYDLCNKKCMCAGIVPIENSCHPYNYI